jgi:hypothetical protein
MKMKIATTKAAVILGATLMIGSAQAQTTLIDNTTRNGSFEVFTGTGSPNALTPDVTDWTSWFSSDQGSYEGTPSHGLRSFFLDVGSGAINMTGHTIAVGDVITWGSKHTNTPNTKTGLVFDNGSSISWVSKPGSDATSTAVESVSGSYTVLVTDTDIIGSELGFGIECSGQWGNTDEVFLSVTPVSTLPVPAITDIEVDAQTGEVTLTARVKPNTVHAFERSGDLTGWIEITDDVTTTTGEVELRYIPAAGVGRECYRLREF